MKKTKKFVSLLCAMVMVLVWAAPAGAAVMDPISGEYLHIAKELRLSVESVIESDSSALSELSYTAPTDQWVLLKDAEGTDYAYLVPLDDATGKVIGYSVVSFVGGIRTLTTAIGNTAATYISVLLEENNTSESMIYSFPDVFIKKEGENYYKICLNGTLEEITDISKYMNTTVSFLSGNEVCSIAPQSDVNEVYGSLDDWDFKKFVPISERVSSSNNYYYGGYQGWLVDEGISEFWANRSCGVTAAANMMQYMATHVSGKSLLYPIRGLTKDQFNGYQKGVYNCLSPAIYGIPTINVMIDGVKEFALGQHVSLNPVLRTDSWTEANVRDYIAEGLNQESPVLLLTWNSPIPDLNAHWVTVTRIYRDNSGTKIVTSNWAEKQTYDFSTWVNGNSIYQGVIYFE